MRILVTGAAGSIGSVMCTGLLDRGREVLGVDVMTEPPGFVGEWFTADCSDPDAVSAVFASAGRVDAVVHLAGNPGEASLPEELTSHVHTTAALLEAMVAHEVRRIAYASSNHAVGYTPRTTLPGGLLGVDVPPRPDTFYGAAKVAAEALLRLYVDRCGIEAVAMRIGAFGPQPESARDLAIWLSHDDAVRMVEAAVTAADPGFAVLYGVSANTRGWWDLGPGRALGFEPQDDAEAFASGIEPQPGDEAEAAYVGGEFVSDRYHIPPF
jgi:uronate dehydrogenase